jgi:hypothetical protein
VECSKAEGRRDTLTATTAWIQGRAQGRSVCDECISPRGYMPFAQEMSESRIVALIPISPGAMHPWHHAPYAWSGSPAVLAADGGLRHPATALTAACARAQRGCPAGSACPPAERPKRVGHWACCSASGCHSSQWRQWPRHFCMAAPGLACTLAQLTGAGATGAAGGAGVSFAAA